MEENKLYCSHCGVLIDTDDYEEIGGEIVCSDCIDHHTTNCDCCGSRIWISDEYGDEYTTLCYHCYNNHYTCDEIEEMIADHALLRETLRAIKLEDDESLYDYAGGYI